jgi:L-alanine-DL-glutamate epimerase-like enolase superfamily enzyme
MKICSITAWRFDSSFKHCFKHASASRSATENIIAVVESENGQIGYGEGCPRAYVTGETAASSAAFIDRHSHFLSSRVRRLSDVEDWISRNGTVIDANPAAFCAVELALLDLLAKSSGASVEGLLGLAELTGGFQYSAVLDASEPAVFATQLQRCRDAGFRDFKIKLSGDVAQDRERLSCLQGHAQEGLRLRADANNLWHKTTDCIAYLEGLDNPFFAIEEPLQANNLVAFLTVSRALNRKIILDESLLRAEQMEALTRYPECWILNCRVSKLGGLLRSLALVKRAKTRGLEIIVGAHVGETSLLTRAGLTLAQNAGAALVAQEGAFGTHLLVSDLCRPALMFQAGGVLSAGDALTGCRAGWGLEVEAQALRQARRLPLAGEAWHTPGPGIDGRNARS